jgi:pSer/pThr/pTyr-binding forkhead associated (FHA) protein
VESSNVGVSYQLRYRGTRFPLRLTETTIGRSHYCPIVLSNPLASRQHAKIIVRDDGGLEIIDLGSSNGTRVNGELIAVPRRLAPGDIISIGSDMLEVVTVPGAGELPRISEEDEAPDTGRSPDGGTSLQTTLQFIEGLVATAIDSPTASNIALSVRRATDQYLLGKRSRFDWREALRLAAAIEALRAAFPDGSLDAWCAETLAKIEPHLKRPPTR